MPIEVKDGVDLVNGTGITGGIIAMVTTFGWWLRRERSEKAKTAAEISASNAQISASESQAKQIEALTKRVNEQGELIIALGNEIDRLKHRLANRDAARIGIRVLVSLLNVCDGCAAHNEPILEKIRKLLDEDDHDNE